MGIGKFSLLVFLFFVIFAPFVFGASGEISLVTVGESFDGEKIGGVADISLKVKPGSGKVFIDSFPFTREDTQVSVRFAKDIACNFLELDCSVLDFFYSIDIGSTHVGGPSAGAAISALTISVLNNEVLDDSVVVTGTINSGGIVGPVSGLREKAVAARNAGFDKILVPKFSVLSDKTLDGINESGVNISDVSVDSNITIFYADSLVVDGIDVVPVSTLEEILFEFTGKTYPDYSHEINVPEQYQDIMRRVSGNLCNRSELILGNLSDDVIRENEVEFDEAYNSVERGLNATASSDFYSAASFCFSANTILRTLEFSILDNETLKDISDNLYEEFVDALFVLESVELETMSDLETYIIVRERLMEVEQLFDEENHLDNLGYIVERFFSASAWSSFFEYEGESIELDDAHLKSACISKISEAEERLSYIDFLTGSIFDRSELEDVHGIKEQEDYAFCIFRAAKVKADANAIILSMSLSRDMASDLIEDQLTFARMQINKQGSKFPILGYSYYNYASTLKDSRPQLSIIFAEYASEFSNLDIYFPSERRVPWFLLFRSYDGLFLGLVIGFALCIGLFSSWFLLHRLFAKKSKKRRKMKRSRK